MKDCVLGRFYILLKEFFLFNRIQHDHMKKLSAVVTPTHKDLAIPRVYHYECPWPAAQAEIFMINAYKVSNRIQIDLKNSHLSKIWFNL